MPATPKNKKPGAGAAEIAAKDQQNETKKAAQARATQRLLLDVGRQLFAEKGYAGTSVEDICAATGMTRGALYHHHRGKEDLFRAVLEDVEQHLYQRVARKADVSADTDPWQILEAGVKAFLDETSDPVVQQIVIIDGPSVLGYDAWREIDERYAFGGLTHAMKNAIAAGVIDEQPVEPLARLLKAAVNEASLAIAQADKPRVAKREMTDAALRYLSGLRAQGP